MSNGPQTQDERLRSQAIEDFAAAFDKWLPLAQHAVVTSEDKIHTTLGFSVSLLKKLRGEDELNVEMTTQPRAHVPEPKKRYKLDIHKGKQLVFQGVL